MSIERYGNLITFVCDGCGDADPTFCSVWSGALAKFKAHGGRVVKSDDPDGEEWEHECKGCPG